MILGSGASLRRRSHVVVSVAWLDGGCFRRGGGGLRRGLLRRNNCRPAVELINFRAKDAAVVDPGGETLRGASLGVWGTMYDLR